MILGSWLLSPSSSQQWWTESPSHFKSSRLPLPYFSISCVLLLLRALGIYLAPMQEVQANLSMLKLAD